MGLEPSLFMSSRQRRSVWEFLPDFTYDGIKPGFKGLFSKFSSLTLTLFIAEWISFWNTSTCACCNSLSVSIHKFRSSPVSSVVWIWKRTDSASVSFVWQNFSSSPNSWKSSENGSLILRCSSYKVACLHHPLNSRPHSSHYRSHKWIQVIFAVRPRWLRATSKNRGIRALMLTEIVAGPEMTNPEWI